MNKKMNLISALVLASLMSCQGVKVKKKESKPKDSTPTQSQPQNQTSASTEGTVKSDSQESQNINTELVETVEDFSNELKYEIVETAQPMKYKIKFSWKDFKTPVLLGFKMNGQLRPLSSSKKVHEIEVDHNQAYVVEFILGVEDETTQQVIKSFEIHTPLDVVVSSDSRQNLQAMYERTAKGLKLDINRMYFMDETQLVIPNEYLVLNVNKVYSNQEKPSVIKNFTGNTFAATPDQNGVHGAQLILNIDSLYGKILVDIRGQDGANGKNGEEYQTRAADGVNAIAKTVVGFGKQYCAAGTGRPASNGEDGLKGRTGYNGKNGGNSGSVKLNINKIENLKFEKDIFDTVFININAGSKGIGGIGGNGQKGGVGGKAAGSIVTACSFRAGQNGSDGAKGDNGADGKDGTRGQACLKVNLFNFQSCE